MNGEEYLIEWNEEKNKILKKERKVSFEMIEILLSEKKYIKILKNPSSNFKNQFIILVNIDDYIYYVPFVIDKKEKRIFLLKTIIPSRKYTKQLLKNNIKNYEK